MPPAGNPAANRAPTEGWPPPRPRAWSPRSAPRAGRTRRSPALPRRARRPRTVARDSRPRIGVVAPQRARRRGRGELRETRGTRTARQRARRRRRRRDECAHGRTPTADSVPPPESGIMSSGCPVTRRDISSWRDASSRARRTFYTFMTEILTRFEAKGSTGGDASNLYEVLWVRESRFDRRARRLALGPPTHPRPRSSRRSCPCSASHTVHGEELGLARARRREQLVELLEDLLGLALDARRGIGGDLSGEVHGVAVDDGAARCAGPTLKRLMLMLEISFDE